MSKNLSLWECRSLPLKKLTDYLQGSLSYYWNKFQALPWWQGSDRTHLCTTRTERLGDWPDGSRWAMALLLGLPFLSLLFCIGLWLILRWRIPRRCLEWEDPSAVKSITVIPLLFIHSLSLSSIMQQFVYTVCLYYTSSESVFHRVPPFVLVLKVLLCCFPSTLFQLQNVFMSLYNILPSLSFYFNYLSIYCLSV